MSTKVEQWMKDAGLEVERKDGEAITAEGLDDKVNPVRSGLVAEIIAAHCPYSSSAVEELVRAAKRFLPSSPDMHRATVAQIALYSALAALEKEKQHGR